MEEHSVPISVPLDSDGFLRRECPTCERQFKWYAHQQGDPDAESVDQYFCPLCGVPSASDRWWTPEQLDHATGAVGPALDQRLRDLLTETFGGIKGIRMEPQNNFTLGIAAPTPLYEPDDMVIVQPLCHPNEPIKVPEAAVQPLHCLICGKFFAV